MTEQGLVKRVWNAMRGRGQPAPALSEEDRRVMSAMARLRAIGVVENRILHLKASIFLDAALRTYREGISDSYAAAIDEQEEVMRRVYSGQLPLDEEYGCELARRALEPGGLEAAQSWIEAAEPELQGTPSSMYPNLAPTHRLQDMEENP